MLVAERAQPFTRPPRGCRDVAFAVLFWLNLCAFVIASSVYIARNSDSEEPLWFDGVSVRVV